jgi:HSP20 family protein
MLDIDFFDFDKFEVPKHRPAVNLYETKDTYVVEAELAGARKGDINVEFTGDTLRISGVRQQYDETESRRYHAAEIYFGPFERRIIIHDDLDIGRIKTSFRSGLLRIVIPKKVKKVVSIEIEEG